MDAELVIVPAEPARRRARSASSTYTPIVTVTRVLFLLALLLILQYLVPYFLERYHYAITRGRQQAEYDIATVGLKEMPLNSLSKAYQLVSQHVGPSVVHINVRSVHEGELPNEFAQLYGPPGRELRGQGSGVIIDPQGYIVTNYHVVLGAREIQVSLSDGRVVSARIVGVDTLTDLAVLKIDVDNLIAAEWGNSDDLRVGALVWAVGSPFGLQRTITFGILSAKHRSGMAGEVYQDFLQTDAAVNPGNSGGPLVDTQGRVVGINTAILGDSYQGVSFAIPSSVAKNVYQRLKTAGQVARGWLGVQLREVDEEDILRYGLSDMKGAFVARVVDEPDVPCPARDAGIQVRDIVIDWNGTPIHKPAELIRLVAMTDAGTTATVVVLRGGRRISLEVLVAKRPAFLDS
jgi:S1-C subfamily serine protease